MKTKDDNLIAQAKEDFEKSPSARWAYRVAWVFISLGMPILSYQKATLQTPDYSMAFIFIVLAAMFGWMPLFFETPIGKKLYANLKSKAKQN